MPRARPGDLNTVVVQNIRRWREQRAVTATDLSIRLGWAPNQVSRLESGTVNVSVDQLAAIAKALRVAPGRLFDKRDSS